MRWLLLLLALGDLGSRVDGRVDGDHYFRQAHIAANIDWLLRQPWSWPRAWNVDMPLRLYDFPVYQYVVAALASLLSTPPAATAQAVNVIAFAVAFAALWRLLVRLGAGELAVTLALACFAAAPIVRFYFARVHSDPLLVALALVSLAAFVRREGEGRARLATVGWLAMAFVVTLAKSPIYLPFAVAVLACRYRRLGFRGLWRRDLAAFAGCMLAALLLYHRCYVWANASAPGGADTPWSWYFGSWQERVSWHPYDTVLQRLGKQALPLAALPGLLLVAAGRGKSTVVVAWASAATASSLLFLHVNTVHNYYQLPAAPALAAAAGLGLGSIDRLRWGWLRAVSLLALGAGIVVTSQHYFARIAAPRAVALQQAGAFVQAHTAPRDFVLIVRTPTDPHPAPHWFAQRQGVIAAPEPWPAASLQAWRHAAHAAGGRLCCFVPHELSDPAAAVIADWRLLATADCGALYCERP